MFGPLWSRQNIIGSVRGRGHKIDYFWVRSRLRQKITGHYRVGVPNTLPRRTLIAVVLQATNALVSNRVTKFLWNILHIGIIRAQPIGSSLFVVIDENLHGLYTSHVIGSDILKIFWTREGAFPFWRCHVCRAVQTSRNFQHRCHPMTPYFYWKLMALTQRPPTFLPICHQKPVIFKFQQQIGYFKWLCAQSSFFKVRNSI